MTSPAVQLNIGLGAFSLGLGLAELLAPRRVGRTTGVEAPAAVLRAYGLREIAAGALILARPRSPLGPWSRVAGDLLDIATLAWAAQRHPEQRGRIGLAFAAVTPVVVLDLVAAYRLGVRA